MAEESCEVKSAGPSSPRSPPNSSGAKISSPQSPKKPNRRVKLSELQLENLSKEDLLTKWREQEQYLDYLESQAVTHEGEITSLKESEGKYRQQFLEASHREKVLVRRLASKEQELQEYMNQISEMKAAQAPTAASLRSTLLDPAVNILIQKLRQELISTKAKLEDTQNELSAWKFTPDSNTGKRLMAKCRLLYQENEELGRMISSGRMAKLEGELALQKSFSEEVKKSQSELDEFLQDLDEDVEGMQSTIYFLQQELRKAHESVTLLQQENLTLKANAGENNLTNGLSPHTPPIIKKEENNETLTTSEISTEVKVKTEDSDRFKGARTPPLPLENSIQLESVDCNLSVEKIIENRTEIKQTEHNNDESSNDSTSNLMIKVENERIDEEEEINRNNKRTLRTKTNSNNKNNSGKTNGEEVLTRTTRGRDRSKREKSSVASSGDDEKIMQKKKRRETHVSSSTDRNEDVDNSIVTNGETLQSDAE